MLENLSPPFRRLVLDTILKLCSTDGKEPDSIGRPGGDEYRCAEIEALDYFSPYEPKMVNLVFAVRDKELRITSFEAIY